MKKSTLAALALALPLTIGSALATPLTPEYIRGYGNVYDNQDGNQSYPYGWFSLAGLNLTSNSVLTLTLTYLGTGSNESWSAYADNSFLVKDWLGSYWDVDNVTSASNSLAKSNLESITSFVFSSTENKDIFNSILRHQSGTQTLDFWFSEGTNGSDRFTLKNASLDVTSAVVVPTPTPTPTPTAPIPEPESYALLLAGLGMMGAVARRNKHKRA